MLKLIYGTFGSGKTYCSDTLILDALRQGKEAILLVPEQEVMEAERRIADRADAESVLCEKLTVVSFRRLADLAFRKYGTPYFSPAAFARAGSRSHTPTSAASGDSV